MPVHPILVVEARQESLREEAARRRLVDSLQGRPSLIKRLASLVNDHLVSSSYGAPMIAPGSVFPATH